VNDDPLPLKILGLRAQIAELSDAIRQSSGAASTMPHCAC
jgi:hypothetical protein